MLKSQAAINRAELELRKLSKRAREYYSVLSDGSWVEEYDGKFIVKYPTSETEEYDSLKDLDNAYREISEQLIAQNITLEFEALNDDYDKAVSIIKLYNELFGDDWDEDNIINDYEYGYLTINEGKDGEEYAYYLDEKNCMVINLKTDEIDKDAIFIEANF